MAQNRKKVLVLGAGYAGLQTIKKEISTDEAEITLINKMNIIMNQHGYMKLLLVLSTMKT